MTLLDERPLSPEERQAIADEPTPGVWIEERPAYAAPNDPTEFAPRGDGRLLEQHETDVLIVRELWNSARGDVRRQEALRDFVYPWFANEVFGNALQQRGGLHSDEIVRLLAFRAWGDRDRRWFETTDIERLVERYRVALGLQPFKALRDESFRMGVFPRRSGRTVEALLYSIATCTSTRQRRLVIATTSRPRARHVHDAARDIIERLGLDIHVEVRSDDDRGLRGVGAFVHRDHF